MSPPFTRHVPFVVASSSDFVATSVANCRSWHRASLGVTNVGGAASAWADQSGAGDSNRNLVQGTAGNRPAITATNASFNNRATLDFDGAGDFLASGGAWSGGTYAQPTTIYVAMRFSSVTLFSYVFDSSDGTGGTRQALLINTGPQWYQFAGASLTGGTPASATTYILACVYDGASSAVYANQYNTAAVSGDAGSNALHSLTVGLDYSGAATSLSGSVAEVISYSGAHASGTRQTVMQALGTMYGVSVTA